MRSFGSGSIRLDVDRAHGEPRELAPPSSNLLERPKLVAMSPCVYDPGPGTSDCNDLCRFSKASACCRRDDGVDTARGKNCDRLMRGWLGEVVGTTSSGPRSATTSCVVGGRLLYGDAVVLEGFCLGEGL